LLHAKTFIRETLSAGLPVRLGMKKIVATEPKNVDSTVEKGMRRSNYAGVPRGSKERQRRTVRATCGQYRPLEGDGVCENLGPSFLGWSRRRSRLRLSLADEGLVVGLGKSGSETQSEQIERLRKGRK